MTIEEALKVIDLNIDKLNGSMQMAVRTLLQDKTIYEEGFTAGLKWRQEQPSEEQMLKKSMPTWKRSRNNYEDPCIGSAFEKTGRRYTALYMGGYFIDLDDLFNKLPKEDSK